ncbi:3-oxoadipate enol-lactonase [Chitinasiproducens palmae]|uniref:3-oxoadipate enol-lactonase n=1 Tax=Chitinasiproducens palmae TaxID=1770053 RepID=A0A1H2PJ75_9BURK|nr:3-oxoadipate enol-lactonase [Chitinasiproducens palmae]SDV46345.1 3-oxoadipate enol-lactonase [Chitinasiproducens palmae]
MPYADLPDVRLHYELEGDVQRPVLMLSNSLGTSLDMWAPQRDAWLRDFRLLRYDTRGHGQSSVPPGPYRFATLAADAIGLLDHLGLQKVHFCGLSMGGITGQQLALDYPDRIERLVLSNTAAYIGPPENWENRASAVERDGIGSIADAVISRWLTPPFAAANPERAAALKAILLRSPDAGYAANCRALAASDLRERIASITQPTLVIAGSGDVPTPPSDAAFLASHIQNARLVEFDAAHLSNWEQPQAFAEAVSDFLLN